MAASASGTITVPPRYTTMRDSTGTVSFAGIARGGEPPAAAGTGRDAPCERDPEEGIGVHKATPELLDLPGVGGVSSALILTVWSHPGRIRNEAAFAMIGGICPIPASSGITTRHRLNRGGDRRLSLVGNTIVLARMRTDPATRAHVERRRSEGETARDIRRHLKQPPDLPIAARRPPQPGGQGLSGQPPRTLTAGSMSHFSAVVA